MLPPSSDRRPLLKRKNISLSLNLRAVELWQSLAKRARYIATEEVTTDDNRRQQQQQ